MNVKNILLITTFILANISCNNNSSHWKKIGEIKLNGKNLVLKIPKAESFNEKFIRFYISSINRKVDKNNLEAYQIGFYDGKILSLDEEGTSGAFQIRVYKSMDINQDSENYYLEIPNRFLFDTKMKLWSAYEKEVFVNGIELYSKRTGKIDVNDPYPYISIFK